MTSGLGQGFLLRAKESSGTAAASTNILSALVETGRGRQGRGGHNGNIAFGGFED